MSSITIDHHTAAGNYQNLFVAKLPLSVSDAELMIVFALHRPTSATVMLDPVSGRSKGYAFVLFANEADGRHAAAALDKTVATVARPTDAAFSFDLTVFASKHSGREVAAENECLYIRNIPNVWPMARVEAFIAEHGRPVYSAVRSDHLGSPVWVVFVEYDTVESARRTLRAVHGMVVAPRCPPILAKYAESDDVKRNRRDRKCGRPTRGNIRSSANDNNNNNNNNINVMSTKPPRRIDVAHQMHHPCHATRYTAPTSISSTSNSISSTAGPAPIASSLHNSTVLFDDSDVIIKVAPLVKCIPSSSAGSFHDVSSASSCSGGDAVSETISHNGGLATANSSSSSRRFRHNPYSCTSTITILQC